MERFPVTDLVHKVGVVIDAALAEPIMITRHRRDTVVMLNAATYDLLVIRAGQKDEGTDTDDLQPP